jgi:hypothetical protein
MPKGPAPTYRRTKENSATGKTKKDLYAIPALETRVFLIRNQKSHNV